MPASSERRDRHDLASARRALYDAAIAYAASASDRNDTQARYDGGQADRDELHESNMLAVVQGLRLERRARALASMTGERMDAPLLALR